MQCIVMNATGIHS